MLNGWKSFLTAISWFDRYCNLEYYHPFVQGPRELQKSGGAKSPILPHFSENSSFIAFLCDNFFWILKVRGGRGPPGPRGYEAPAIVTPKCKNCTFMNEIILQFNNDVRRNLPGLEPKAIKSPGNCEGFLPLWAIVSIFFDLIGL